MKYCLKPVQRDDVTKHRRPSPPSSERVFFDRNEYKIAKCIHAKYKLNRLESRGSTNNANVAIVGKLRLFEDEIFRKAGDSLAFELLANVPFDDEEEAYAKRMRDDDVVKGLANRGRFCSLYRAFETTKKGSLSAKLSSDQKTAIVKSLIKGAKVEQVDCWAFYFDELDEFQSAIEEAYVSRALSTMERDSDHVFSLKTIECFAYFIVRTGNTAMSALHVDTTNAMRNLVGCMVAQGEETVRQNVGFVLVVVNYILHNVSVDGRLPFDDLQQILGILQFVSMQALSSPTTNDHRVIDAGHCIVLLALLDKNFAKRVVRSKETATVLVKASEVAQKSIACRQHHHHQYQAMRYRSFFADFEMLVNALDAGDARALSSLYMKKAYSF